MLVTEIEFRTGRRYEKSLDLLQKLGLEDELSKDYMIRDAKTEGGAYPKVSFTDIKGANRAVFISPVAERHYKLHLPDNHALYNKVHGLLTAKNVRFAPQLVHADDLGLTTDNRELLRFYD